MIKSLLGADGGPDSVFLAKLTNSGLGPANGFSTSFSVHAIAKSRRVAISITVFGEITLQIKDPDQPGLRDANDWDNILEK